MLNVKINLMEGAKMPTYARKGDAGVDLYPLENAFIAPRAKGVLIKTGISMEIPEGFELQVRPKSGNSIKTPLRVVLGTVDAGYRGEIGIIIDNLSNKVIKVSKDKALAQGVFNRVYTVNFKISEMLNRSERGKNGFGSTGRGL